MKLETILRSVNDYMESRTGPPFIGGTGERLYHRVSAGAQSAAHPFFGRLADMIAGHRMPLDFFREAYPSAEATEGLAVLSFAFHIDPSIVRDNAGEGFYPSRSWYEARHLFNSIVPQFLDHLRGLFPGARMAVPSRSALYRADLTVPVPVANWSERHVAYACGLGTFGLHGALITGLGCTHRLLSVVVDREVDGCLDPPADPYRDCPHIARGACGACIARCPVGAVVPGRHIIERCFAHENVTCKNKSAVILGVEEAACGLCMSGVPCSTRRPS